MQSCFSDAEIRSLSWTRSYVSGDIQLCGTTAEWTWKPRNLIKLRWLTGIACCPSAGATETNCLDFLEVTTESKISRRHLLSHNYTRRNEMNSKSVHPKLNTLSFLFSFKFIGRWTDFHILTSLLNRIQRQSFVSSLAYCLSLFVFFSFLCCRIKTYPSIRME
jgi:hypothetical protein